MPNALALPFRANCPTHKDIIAAEGRIYFAGEHASLEHAWIQGAIESGLRTASQIHALSI